MIYIYIIKISCFTVKCWQAFKALK